MTLNTIQCSFHYELWIFIDIFEVTVRSHRTLGPISEMACVYSALQWVRGTGSIWVQEHFPLMVLVFFLQFEANTKGAIRNFTPYQLESTFATWGFNMSFQKAANPKSKHSSRETQGSWWHDSGPHGACNENKFSFLFVNVPEPNLSPERRHK